MIETLSQILITFYGREKPNSFTVFDHSLVIDVTQKWSCLGIRLIENNQNAKKKTFAEHTIKF